MGKEQNDREGSRNGEAPRRRSLLRWGLQHGKGGETVETWEDGRFWNWLWDNSTACGYKTVADTIQNVIRVIKKERGVDEVRIKSIQTVDGEVIQ